MSAASDRLAAYIAAENAILTTGQEVRFGDRWLRAADLVEIREQITKLEAQVAQESRTAAGGYGVRYSTANFAD